MKCGDCPYFKAHDGFAGWGTCGIDEHSVNQIWHVAQCEGDRREPSRPASTEDGRNGTGPARQDGAGAGGNE